MGFVLPKTPVIEVMCSWGNRGLFKQRSEAPKLTWGKDSERTRDIWRTNYFLFWVDLKFWKGISTCTQQRGLRLQQSEICGRGLSFPKTIQRQEISTVWWHFRNFFQTRAHIGFLLLGNCTWIIWCFWLGYFCIVEFTLIYWNYIVELGLYCLVDLLNDIFTVGFIELLLNTY